MPGCFLILRRIRSYQRIMPGSIIRTMLIIMLFIGFVATIIRSRIYTLLKDEVGRMDKRQNYMTVPAAIKELEKIELLKGADNEYNLDYAVTATQKAILKAFDMTADNIHKQARAISSDLARVEIEAIEAANS